MSPYVMIGAFVVVNFLDFVMLYCFGKNITRRKIEFFSWSNSVVLGWKNSALKIPVFLFCIFYAVTLGILLYTLDGHTFRLVGTITDIVVVKMLFKRSFIDSLLIYALVLFCGVILQGLTILVLMPILTYEILLMLVSQVLTAIIVITLCNKAQIFKVFNYFKTNVLLKMVFLIIAAVIIGFFFFLNFENNPTYIAYFLGLIFLILFVLTPLWLRLYKRLETDVKRAHFITNKILAAYFSAEMTEDIHEIREELKNLLAHVSPESAMEKIVNDDMEAMISSFIEKKKKQHQVKVDVVTEVNHFENHKTVKSGAMLSFLGLLLDNAFEAETEKPILIDYGSVHHACHLTLSNEYLQTRNTNLEMMFEKRYSTKGDYGRGYGLYELKKEVEELGGQINCFDVYNETYDAYYLTFVIEFRN